MRIPRLALLAAVLAGPAWAERGILDFERPVVDRQQILDPWIDPATGVIVAAGREGFRDAAVGLVWNLATSACVGPADRDQKLGVGRRSAGDASVGFASAPLAASFLEPLPPPVHVSVEIQAPVFATAELELFAADGTPVARSRAVLWQAGEPGCPFPGLPRGRGRLAATAEQAVARAVVRLTVERVVFVIDDLEFEGAGAAACRP